MREATTDPRSATTRQPGALDGAGLRHVVIVLSTVQITSWGVLFYAFAALQSSITADTGWSSVAVTGAFSLAQFVSGGVGIWVGRHIDDFGPRKVMTAASLVAIPGVLTIALAPNLAVFYAGWVLTGIAMAGTLYPPAFAALTRWGGDQRVRALTTLTLVGGPGQHRVRTPGGRTRRLGRLAQRLPGAAGRTGPHHRSAALVGPEPSLAPRAPSTGQSDQPGQADDVRRAERLHAAAVARSYAVRAAGCRQRTERRWRRSLCSSTWCRCSSSRA